MSDKHRVVVVGGGMAAARLAEQLGPRPQLSLTVLAEERHPAYNRVLLADALAGRYGQDLLTLPAPSASVRWRAGVRAVRIDRTRLAGAPEPRRPAGEVLCDDGAVHPYDTLVLATGANPVLPAIQGLFGDQPQGPDRTLPGGVHPFRTLGDCAALAREAATVPRAVVVGGGLLGVSAARALAARGVRTVLAQQAEHLMERQLDAGAATLLRRHLAQLGVEVHTECRVRRVRTLPSSGPAGRVVRSVLMADGHELDCELVVLACGVRPRTGLARASGLTVGRGVTVDDQLRTSDPDIHAIGDCAEHAGVVYGLAAPAREQADVVARLLTGAASARYRGTHALTRLTLPGEGPLDLAAFGETEAGAADEVVQLNDATAGAYRKVVVREGRVVGGILLGDLSAVEALTHSWADPDSPSSHAPPGDRSHAPLLHLLTHDGGPQ